MIKNFISKLISTINEADTLIILFCLFIFSLPFWRRIEIFTKYSLLDGKFIDYLTYSVFGFDIILSFVLLCWLIRTQLLREKMIFFNRKVVVSFLILILLSFGSIFFAAFRPISLYYAFFLSFLFVLVLFIYNIAKTKKDLFLILNFFVFSMFFQSIIAIVQFFKNQSLGLSFLGEQLISPGVSGVAKIVMYGEKHIRPYGTFSHPNVLALFLLAALIVAIYLFIQYKEKIFRVSLGVISAFLLFGIFLTFSRIIWILTLLSLFYLLFKERKIRIILKDFFRKKQNVYYLIGFIIIMVGVLAYFLPSIWWRINPLASSTWDSFNDRMVVISKSIILIKNNPFIGVGIGNFVIEIVYLLTGYPIWMAEPVHNTYMLVLVELGILGLTSYLFMLYYIYRESHKAPYFLRNILLTFIIYMFFDHCFWDIRQVQYLFFVFVGLILAMGKINNHSI